ncbi:MAG: ATP-binding protein [Myxococcaceae bacterium]
MRFLDQHGSGLPGVYEALITRSYSEFQQISAEISQLFPTVKQLQLKTPTSGTKALGVLLRDGTWVRAQEMSEGLLYFLAFAVLRYVSRPALVLIEEPETGLHPARIREVASVLRAVSKQTQVIVATHSPLFINELQADEVSLITRDASTGTHARLLKDTENFEERSKIYALGELWLSYADGTSEGGLVGPH